MIIDKKLIVKAVIYRLMAFVAIAVVGYIFTGRYEISLLIALVDLLIKTGCYYFYDVLWRKIEPKLLELWGKIKSLFGGK